jgi:hypothetical protein
MKKYTQEEFDNLDIVNGVRQCPTGDYSNIKIFGKQCSFGEDCSFGRWCSFGKRCSFGEWCSFGKQCSFGEDCSFGRWCSFGKRCSFGEWCSFGKQCSFGEWCSFGKQCSFGEWCSFGKRCSFGEWCSFGKQCSFGEWCSICENELSGFKMRNISGLGDSNQTLYLWETVNGYYCQTDYFFGTESEFVEDVTLKYGGDHRYIKAVEFLKG